MNVDYLVEGRPEGTLRLDSMKPGDQVILADGRPAEVIEVLRDRGVRARFTVQSPRATYEDTRFLTPEEFQLDMRSDDTRLPSVLPMAHRATAASWFGPSVESLDLRAWHEALRADPRARREQELKRSELLQMHAQCGPGVDFPEFLSRCHRVAGVTEEQWPEVRQFLFPFVPDRG